MFLPARIAQKFRDFNHFKNRVWA
ncbi:MAG: hypothetical protein JWP79_867, partial [Polaromonas sp.]|nr:hypothetical protein [Polaromonas sp.]